MERARYGRLYIRWYNITGGLTYDDAAYLSLMKNFKELGYLEDYDCCYFQYRKEHRDRPWPGIDPLEQTIRKFIDFFLQQLYGYGTKPLRPMGLSIGTILIFGIIWGVVMEQRRREIIISDEYSQNQAFDKPNKNSLLDKIHMLLKPFIFSAVIFLSGTRLFVDPPEIPEIQRLPKSIIKGAFTLERVLGAFFSILFFLAIGTTVVR